MASIFVSKPGSRYGPCACICSHIECAELRANTEIICSGCGEMIGYERDFREYRETILHDACIDDYDRELTLKAADKVGDLDGPDDWQHYL